MKKDPNLTAQIEPFDTFWEAPENVEKGYRSFSAFYEYNYSAVLPKSKNAVILVISCGAGYFLEYLKNKHYFNAIGIDSDQEKVSYGKNRGLNCRNENSFPFLQREENFYDFIFVEQEINHLTKKEIIDFLKLCRRNLKRDGRLVIHSLNGANPITGSEALAQNFDHYNTLTEYSLKQVLNHTGFIQIRVFPLRLYVFYRNPLNYVGILIDTMLTAIFRLGFLFYGKKNKIFTKKIGAIAKN